MRRQADGESDSEDDPTATAAAAVVRGDTAAAEGADAASAMSKHSMGDAHSSAAGTDEDEQEDEEGDDEDEEHDEDEQEEDDNASDAPDHEDEDARSMSYEVARHRMLRRKSSNHQLDPSRRSESRALAALRTTSYSRSIVRGQPSPIASRQRGAPITTRGVEQSKGTKRRRKVVESDEDDEVEVKRSKLGNTSAPSAHVRLRSTIRLHLLETSCICCLRLTNVQGGLTVKPANKLTKPKQA